MENTKIFRRCQLAGARQVAPTAVRVPGTPGDLVRYADAATAPAAEWSRALGLTRRAARPWVASASRELHCSEAPHRRAVKRRAQKVRLGLSMGARTPSQ